MCGGLQLRGATEWMNPEHLFSSGVVSVANRAPRTDQQPAPPSGPNPVGSHPVSRGGRAPFDRGDAADDPVARMQPHRRQFQPCVIPPLAPHRAVGARRTLHLRFNDLVDPQPIPRDTDYALGVRI
jgi:hypothetical protein